MTTNRTEKIGKLVNIKWRDSRMYISQMDKDDDFTVAIICSTGFVVSEDKKQIVIAGDVLEDGDVRRVIVIPKENII